MSTLLGGAYKDVPSLTRQVEYAVPVIYQQISRVMADIGAVSKDRKNEQQKYSFRGIEDFYQAAHPALIKHGVFCAPEVLERQEYRFEKTNDFGKTTTWLHVTLKVRHRFFASDGSYIDVITCGEGLDNSDKASNKAMSGAMKYALIELFCVPTKDIEDADRETLENGTRRKAVEVTTEDIPLPKKSAATGNGASAVSKGPAKAADVPVIYCSKVENESFYARIREALPRELKHVTEEWGRAFLKDKGYRKADGEGSLKNVDKALFPELLREAIQTIREVHGEEVL